MNICDFCTLKRHWKEGFPLHWPCIDSKASRKEMAKKELENKRLEDARKSLLKVPNAPVARSPADLRILLLGVECKTLLSCGETNVSKQHQSSGQLWIESRHNAVATAAAADPDADVVVVVALLLPLIPWYALVG